MSQNLNSAVAVTTERELISGITNYPGSRL